MIDGTYSVVLKTPMGAKKGDLILSSRDGVLTGTLVVMGKENALEPGTTDGSAYSFGGKLKTAAGVLAFTCTGVVEGDEITGTVATKKGDMQLKGTRK